MIKMNSKGGFEKTEKFLKKSLGKDYLYVLDRYGKFGVDALREHTPVDSGLTADSWYYRVERTETGYRINWYNSNVNHHVNIALILQYGHATRSGSWVEGVDYINPALFPIFKALSEAAWKEVQS